MSKSGLLVITLPQHERAAAGHGAARRCDPGKPQLRRMAAGAAARFAGARRGGGGTATGRWAAGTILVPNTKKGLSIMVLCLPFAAPTQKEIAQFDQLFDNAPIAAVDKKCGVLDGLERQLACLVAVNPDGYRIPLIAGAPIVPPHAEVSPLACVANRPPSEQAVRRLQHIASRGPISVPHLLTAAALLSGTPQSIRTSDVQIRPDGDGVSLVFGPAAQIRPHLRQLLRFITTPSPTQGHAKAFIAMAILLSIHPLADGNGRLARALAQAVLAQQSLLRGPVLPLGPIIKLNDYAHAGAFRAVILHNDWEKLLRFYAAASERTARAVAALLGVQVRVDRSSPARS